MYLQRTVLDLIGSIYDAAGNSILWPVFLNKLGSCLHTRVLSLYVEDLQHQAGQVAARVGFDDEFMVAYERYYRPKNIYLIRGERLLWQGNVCLSEALCPDAEARRTEFYNDFVAPQRLTSNGLNGVILKEQSTVSMLGLIRETGAKPYTERDVEFVHLLIPHLQRAVQLHTRITDLEIRHKASSQALHCWALGVIILDANARVMLVNRAAETILSQRDGLEFQFGQFHAALSVHTSAIHALIHNAINTTPSQAQPKALNMNGKPGGALSLPRPSGRRPLSILVAPAPYHEKLCPVPGAAAIIFISDPDASGEPREGILQELYGLTPAESDVAKRLLQGRDLKEVCDELQITLNTAKTHLKRIFEKTGTKRQAELVRLLLRSPAGLSLGH